MPFLVRLWYNLGMATKKKTTKKRDSAGRPTLYDRKYDNMAYKLCLLGYTDKDLAKFFEVSESTLNLWKKEHPKFSESINKGKDFADGEVVGGLYKRATGFTETIETPMVVSDGRDSGSHVEIVKHKKYFEPHTTAAFIWLKNRQGKRWTDKQQIEHSGSVKISDDIPDDDGN